MLAFGFEGEARFGACESARHVPRRVRGYGVYLRSVSSPTSQANGALVELIEPEQATAEEAAFGSYLKKVVAESVAGDTPRDEGLDGVFASVFEVGLVRVHAFIDVVILENALEVKILAVLGLNPVVD